MTKVRRIDWYPQDWLSGTARLSAMQVAVYITVINLQYAEGGPIQRDDAFIARILKSRTDLVTRAVDALKMYSKLLENVEGLSCKRCQDELKRSRDRIEDAERAAAKRWKNKETTDATASSSAYASARVPSTTTTSVSTSRGASPDGQRAKAAPSTDARRSTLNGAANDLTPEQRAAFHRLKADTLAKFAIIPDQPQSDEERLAVIQQYQELAGQEAAASASAPDPATTPPDTKPNDQ